MHMYMSYHTSETWPLDGRPDLSLSGVKDDLKSGLANAEIPGVAYVIGAVAAVAFVYVFGVLLFS